MSDILGFAVTTRGHSNCLALVANEAYVHGSHRVRTEKQYLTSDSPRT